MRIIFMGSPEFSVPILSSIISAGHDVVAVYCQPPRPAGRGKKERLTPVHSYALELGLDVRHPVNFKSKEAVSDFAALKADIAVVVAYGLILPQKILDSVDKGCLNIHASLLPRWRGAAPIHRAIISGDASTGICIMQMDAGLDTGDVLYHKETEILPFDTTAVLHDRLAHIGSQCIVDVLKKYDFFEAVPQSDIGIIYASKIDKNESKIDWGGGLVYLSVPDNINIRNHLSDIQGHITLLRGNGGGAEAMPIQSKLIKGIEEGLRKKFDPRNILNVGIMG
ncbi:methionyl-tRNA formyltransferase [Amylibacter sp.]|nr:methionyl-tRNA formyltransferase [Amylibacter sp.]